MLWIIFFLIKIQKIQKKIFVVLSKLISSKACQNNQEKNKPLLHFALCLK